MLYKVFGFAYSHRRIVTTDWTVLIFFLLASGIIVEHIIKEIFRITVGII